MPTTLSPERRTLLDQCVEEGWPMREMFRTHGLTRKTVRKYRPDYTGLDRKTSSELGHAARNLGRKLGRNYAMSMYAARA